MPLPYESHATRSTSVRKGKGHPCGVLSVQTEHDRSLERAIAIIECGRAMVPFGRPSYGFGVQTGAAVLRRDGPPSRFPIDDKRSVPFYGTDLLLASRSHIDRNYCMAINPNVTRPGPCLRLRWLRRAPCRGPPGIRRTLHTPCRCFRCRMGVPRTSCSWW